MRFELFVATRYLRAKRRQAVIGIVTFISVAGVAAGVAALIVALAITNGLRRDLQARLLGATAHIELMRTAGDGIANWRPLLERMRQQPHIVAAAPGLYGQVLISRNARSGGGLLKGIVPADERTVSELLSSITSGTSAPLNPVQTVSSLPPIVLGSDLATTIGAAVGDTVLVTSPQGSLSPLGLLPKYQRFTLSGIFHSGFYQYDSSYGLVRLADAQRLFAEPDLLSVLSFKVDDLYQAESISHAIEQAAGPGFQATSWTEQNRELFRALRLEQAVTFIVIGLIVCVAALNILVALTMLVMEKTRDIAVLMSLGVTSAQVRRIFLAQGLLISVTGTVIGLILGYAGAWAGAHTHLVHLSPEVYAIDYLPFAARWTDGMLVAALALGVSLIATLYPSAAAARILPGEALRYE